MKTVFGISALAIATALATSPAATAQTLETPAARPAPKPVTPAAQASRGEIIVTAPVRQSETDVLQGTSILSGAELTRNLRPTIGETQVARQFGAGQDRGALQDVGLALANGGGDDDLAAARLCRWGGGLRRGPGGGRVERLRGRGG